MSRTVLVGIDRPNAPAVASTGERLGRALGLKVVLAHALDDAGPFPYGDSAERERKRFRAQQSADSALHDAGHACPEGEHLTVRGPATSALLEAADLQDAALLVIGSGGVGPIRAAVSGSVSYELVRAAELPVVVIPPGMGQPRQERRFERGAFRPSVVCGVEATDGLVDHVAAAAVLCERAGLDLVLVHVVPPAVSPAAVPAPGIGAPLAHPVEPVAAGGNVGESTLEWAVRTAVAAAPNGDVAIKARIEVGAPADELQRVAALVDAECIVVGSRGRGPLAAGLLGSTSNDLANDGNRPVMIVPDGARLTGLGPRTVPREAPRPQQRDEHAGTGRRTAPLTD